MNRRVPSIGSRSCCVQSRPAPISPSSLFSFPFLSLLLLFVVLSSFPSSSLSTPPFPIPASSYDAQVALFFPLSSFSLSFRERFSLSSNLFRRDGHFSPTPYSREYFDLNANTVTTFNSSTPSPSSCAAYTLSPSSASHHFFLPSYSLLSLITHLPFSSWSYVNRSTVRSVPSDQWHITNLSTTTVDDRILCHDDEGQYYCHQAPASVVGSYAELIDQTTSLTCIEPFLYNFTLDYFVQPYSLPALDGTAPIRLTITGTRRRLVSISATEGRGKPVKPIGETLPFVHIFDWLQVQPLNEVDLIPPPCTDERTTVYSPSFPLSIPPSTAAPPYTRTPPLPQSFSLLVDSYSIFNHSTQQPTPPVVWNRLNDSVESTHWLTPVSNSSITSHSLYYNYTFGGGLVWNVSSSSTCSVQRWSPAVENVLVGLGRPRSLPQLFLPWGGRLGADPYRYHTLEEVHGVKCYRFDAEFKQVVEGKKLQDLYTFTSSIYFLPSQWQTSPVPSVYLQPIRYRNDGIDFHYDEPPTVDHGHDDCEKEKDEEDEREGHKRGNDSEGDQGDPSSIKHTQGSHDPSPPSLPTMYRYQDTWDMYSFSPIISPSSFDVASLYGCSLVVPPDFPPRPPAYSSTVRVSSSLTSQTYGFTEYYDSTSGQYRADGRYHGLDSVEVTNMRSFSSVLFSNPLADESAYGYNSRVNYIGRAASIAWALGGSKSPVPCTVTTLNSSLILSQFIRPTYEFYLDLYPIELWTHADADSINGFPVDQWQFINQTTLPSGDLQFDTATFYFSQPLTLYDPQVPIRFELSRVVIYITEDSREEELEATEVDFVQWTPIAGTDIVHLLPAFTTPTPHSCRQETLDSRYSTLFAALASSTGPQQFTTVPLVPSSFSALIITPLHADSNDLTALRWYVDDDKKRERVDYAPLSIRSPTYSLPHHSTVFQYYEDWGTYDIQLDSCVSINMTSIEALNPLLLHYTGTLPSFFNGGYREAVFVEVDTVDAVNSMCFQQSYTHVRNPHTNFTYTFARRACFAQDRWQQIPSSTPRQVMSVTDTGTRTYSDTTSSHDSTPEPFSVSYEVYLVDSEIPSPTLFNLTSFGCTPSNITYVPPPSDPQGGVVESPDDELRVIVWTVVGGAFGLVIVAGLWCWCKQQRRRDGELEAFIMSLTSASSSTDDLSGAAMTLTKHSMAGGKGGEKREGFMGRQPSSPRRSLVPMI